jgi:hypothetical protein
MAQRFARGAFVAHVPVPGRAVRFGRVPPTAQPTRGRDTRAGVPAHARDAGDDVVDDVVDTSCSSELARLVRLVRWAAHAVAQTVARDAGAPSGPGAQCTHRLRRSASQTSRIGPGLDPLS